MDKLLNLTEVAEYLRVHPSTIYRLVKKHQIPSFKIGSDYRFNLQSIDRWRLGAESPAKTDDSAGDVAMRNVHPVRADSAIAATAGRLQEIPLPSLLLV